MYCGFACYVHAVAGSLTDWVKNAALTKMFSMFNQDCQVLFPRENTHLQEVLGDRYKAIIFIMEIAVPTEFFHLIWLKYRPVHFNKYLLNIMHFFKNEETRPWIY